MMKLKEKIDCYFSIICLALTVFLLTGVIVLLYRSFNNKSLKNEVIKENIKEQVTSETEEIKEEKSSKIKVDIKGAIKNPGVYELENTNNVSDLIKAAGGLKKNADTSNLNLSKRLDDQMVIKVFTKNEISSISKDTNLIENSECANNNVVISACNEKNAAIITNSTSNDNSNTSKNSVNNESNSKDINNENKLISINLATKEELMTLNSVGEAKANAIIEYRNTNGPFKTIEDIKNVSGIGDALFEKIKSNITI